MITLIVIVLWLIIGIFNLLVAGFHDRYLNDYDLNDINVVWFGSGLMGSLILLVIIFLSVCDFLFSKLRKLDGGILNAIYRITRG